MHTDLVFTALADATRRELLRGIVTAGAISATDLAVGRDITRQAVSKHLGILRDAGLVDTVRVGREVRYSADLAPLDEASRWIADTGASWDRRLGALQREVSKRASGAT